MVKYTRNMAAVIAIALCTACGQDNPTPSTTSTVVTTPPTPPNTPNKCDNIKNPLEEIEWLRKMVTEAKEKKQPLLVVQFDYKGRKVYKIPSSTMGSTPCDVIVFCDLTQLANTCGIAGISDEITRNLSNAIVLVKFD